MKQQKNTQSSVNFKKTKQIVFTGILFAIAIVLSIVEGMLPPFTILPGAKLGLSNIVVMYAIFFLGVKYSLSISILKSTFVAITKGAVTGFISFSGGLFSIIIIYLLLFIFKNKVSYLVLSISGAIFHNIGQFLAILFIYGNMGVLAYLPALIIFGVVSGIATATLLKIILPAFKKINFLGEQL